MRFLDSGNGSPLFLERKFVFLDGSRICVSNKKVSSGAEPECFVIRALYYTVLWNIIRHYGHTKDDQLSGGCGQN